MSTTQILEEFAAPSVEELTREEAQRILDVKADEETQARVTVLAEKANFGTITTPEKDEYLTYIETFDRLAVLKSRARRALARCST